MKIFVDFDETLINSKKEVFRLSLFSKEEISDLFDASMDIKFKKFELIRPYIKSAWHYNYIQKFLDSNQTIPSNYFEQLKQNEKGDGDFEFFFFKLRHEAIKNNRQKWIDFFRPYPFGLAFSELIGRLKAYDQVNIITNRDYRSTKLITKLYFPELSHCKILSLSEIGPLANKFDVINNTLRLGDDDEFIFIDDNIEICLNFQRALLNKDNMKGQVFFAKWGNSFPTFNHEINQLARTPEEILNFIRLNY